MKDWAVYKRMLVADVPPHVDPDLSELTPENMKKALLARYTTDFDCETETEWWYCIKDTPVDLNTVSGQRRRNILKALRFFDVRRIDPSEYAEELFALLSAASSEHPKYSRSRMPREQFLRNAKRAGSSNVAEYWGCFLKETGVLCGYILYYRYDSFANGIAIKVDPEYKRLGANVAIFYTSLFEYLNEQKLPYVTVGERNVLHVTQVQQYLHDNFGFRRAYCRLNVVYTPGMKVAVFCLYPFRRLLAALNRHTENYLANNLYVVLEQERIRRSCMRPRAARRAGEAQAPAVKSGPDEP